MDPAPDNLAILLGDLWRPALEISILSVLIYRIYLLLRGTRGWAVVLGLTGFLILILVLTVLTNVFGLTVLSWLIRWLLLALPLAALVIFQPELRTILAEFGNRPAMKSSRQERENIEILIKAAERLSKDRVGALIALERSIHLRTVVESGVELDCSATPEMLETIFFPNNAIHDGGVIIKGNRITFAACIFPLTQSHALEASVGTRHRAALGLSEETDAVVLVISEESGEISYAYKGHLEKGTSLNDLRSFLSSIFIKQVKPRKMKAWFRLQRMQTAQTNRQRTGNTEFIRKNESNENSKETDTNKDSKSKSEAA